MLNPFPAYPAFVPSSIERRSPSRLPSRTYRHPRSGTVLHTTCCVAPQGPIEIRPTDRTDGQLTAYSAPSWPREDSPTLPRPGRWSTTLGRDYARSGGSGSAHSPGQGPQGYARSPTCRSLPRRLLYPLRPERPLRHNCKTNPRGILFCPATNLLPRHLCLRPTARVLLLCGPASRRLDQL